MGAIPARYFFHEHKADKKVAKNHFKKCSMIRDFLPLFFYQFVLLLSLKQKREMNKNVKLEKWQVAQKRHRLSDKQVQMARELGLNPDKLGKIDNHKQESWKSPLPQFIEEIYFKRFKKTEPAVVKVIAGEKAKKKHSTNYFDTFIEVAEGTKASCGTIPPLFRLN